MKGISHQKVCMETIIERQGVSYAEAINTSRPLKDKLLKACSHIEPGTYVWTDDNQGYVNVLKELGCPHKELKSGTSINQIDHLNTVNNLHSQIDEKIRRYRNVSSIYINRYAALFTLQQKCIGMDLQEIALKVVQWLRKRTQFFRVSDMRRKRYLTILTSWQSDQDVYHGGQFEVTKWLDMQLLTNVRPAYYRKYQNSPIC